MITLQPFPTGCADCGGACCRNVPNGCPPWSNEELAKIGDVLPHLEAFTERSHGPERLARPIIGSPCFRLTDDGLCSMQLSGLTIPHECSKPLVGMETCLEERSRMNVS